jgi:ATP-dependent Lon protease
MISQEIEIPREVPVMTMSQTVLFPQAMMPLFIFEPRYREMLSNVLEMDRIFAVAALDEREEHTEASEPPYSIAGVGVVRACKQNPDGSSNLILQGLARVELESIVCEVPYRRARIQQVMSQSDGSEQTLSSIQPTLLALVQIQMRLGAEIPQEVLQFLSNINEPENVLDLAIYTLCPSGTFKQELLETRGILARFDKFESFLRSQIERRKLDRKLKSGLSDDGIGNN